MDNIIVDIIPKSGSGAVVTPYFDALEVAARRALAVGYPIKF